MQIWAARTGHKSPKETEVPACKAIAVPVNSNDGAVNLVVGPNSASGNASKHDNTDSANSTSNSSYSEKMSDKTGPSASQKSADSHCESTWVTVSKKGKKK